MSSEADHLPKLSLDEWSRRYEKLAASGFQETEYGGPLERHVEREGDLRLTQLVFDASTAALRLWNFFLTENQRLRTAREQGEALIGTMKDLGTVPVIAYSFPKVRAFYPDGAWWTPCLMTCSDGLLQQASRLGIDDSFCPVRAMVPAFLNGEHFPLPDLLVCSTGAVCDDFSAVAQRLERLGFPVSWWEMPRRRLADPGEPAVMLPGGLRAPASQVEMVQDELRRVKVVLEEHLGQQLGEKLLADGIGRANRVRRLLGHLRSEVYSAGRGRLPALEMLISEMLAIHFCSDINEAAEVLKGLLAEVRRRNASAKPGISQRAVRIFWVNPVADLRIMNQLEASGGRLCGTDFMFGHALDLIPEELPPLEALARVALADPMVGSALDRARLVAEQCKRFQAEAVVISRIPGASHCAWEASVIRDHIRSVLAIPSVEIEVPSLADSMLPTLRSRLEALIETARSGRAEDE